MPNKLDPVDCALQSLAGQQWPGGNHNHELENKLMRAFEANKSVSRIGQHRVLIPVLVVLVLGSVAFAAAGGVGLIKSWFVTTEINGEVVDVREIVPNEDGSASFTIPVTAAEGENTISLSLEGEANPGEGDQQIATITIEGTTDSDGVHVEIKPKQDDEEE